LNSSLVFNDASLPFHTVAECEQHVPVFFAILKRALKSRVKMVRVNENIGSNWYHVNYAADFSFSQWINNQADRDYKRSLKMIMDKTSTPLILSEEVEQLAAFESSSFELVEDNTAAPAIGSAFLLQMPVVSFLSMPHWYEKIVTVKHEYIEVGNDSIQQKTCEVENISQQNNLTPFLEKIQAERQASSAYLKTLTQYDNDDYQNLIFCTSVLNTFKQLGATEQLLNRIKSVLKGLNEIIETAGSDGELVKNIALNITGESHTTKKDSSLIKYRKFKLPDGSFLTFDLHVKNFPDGKRLYFHPDFPLKKIYIGYFGNHLPT